MAIPINVLVVEDSEPDTTLVIHALQGGGYEPLYERVETAEALRAAILQRSWDLILSDYSMPEFNGLAALELIKSMKVNVPFIFVSGTMGEEAAVNMMKAGANDYFIKGQLARLVPAVEREIESAGARRARQQAEMAIQHLAAIVKSSKDAIYSVNLDGVIISWNAAAQEIYGYQSHEIVGQSVAILFPQSCRKEWFETLIQIRRGKLIGTFETERQRNDGRIISVWLTISLIKDAKNQIVGISVIARDVTKQKQDEKDRLKLIKELTGALKQVQALSSLLPVCQECHRIRNYKNHWLGIEAYVASAAKEPLPVDICPDCFEKNRVHFEPKNNVHP
jgi:two-component system cell cycle sensor histidine kinase/response regulator CckA